jgi:DnaK suppressor protein
MNHDSFGSEGRDDVRGILEERRRELTGELGRLTAPPTGAGVNLSFGKRIGDGTTEAVERLSTTAVARSIAAGLQDVERALKKLDEGTYGTCDRCGAPIGTERLQAIPWATLCIRCAGRAQPAT